VAKPGDGAGPIAGDPVAHSAGERQECVQHKSRLCVTIGAVNEKQVSLAYRLAAEGLDYALKDGMWHYVEMGIYDE